MSNRVPPSPDRLAQLYVRFRQAERGTRQRRFLRRAIERELARRAVIAAKGRRSR